LAGQQTFTDLAEMVAKVRGPINKKKNVDSELEDNEEEYLSEQDALDDNSIRYRTRTSPSNIVD